MGLLTLMTAIVNSLVGLAYTFFCICFHWGEVNRPALYMFIVTSFIGSGAWTVMSVLSGIDVARGARVADDGASESSNV